MDRITTTFFQYLQYEKRLSSHTRSAYQNDIAQFTEYLKTTYDQESLIAVRPAEIRSWIIHLVEAGIQPVSINRKIAALKGLYKFLRREQHIAIDPTANLKALKGSKRLPAFVRQSEIDAVLESSPETSFDSTRDQLITEMFYATGIRLSELIGLNDASFNLADRTVRVLGKRNKERVIPFAANLVPRIQEYQRMRDSTVAVDDDAFFVTASGKRCYPMLVYRIVRTRIASGSNATRKSPHILRHSYATHLLDRGAEINAVKDLLGHASLAATQMYTHNSMEKIKKAYSQAHPKA